MRLRSIGIVILIVLCWSLIGCTQASQTQEAAACQEHGPQWFWADTNRAIHWSGGQAEYGCVHVDSTIVVDPMHSGLPK